MSFLSQATNFVNFAFIINFYNSPESFFDNFPLYMPAYVYEKNSDTKSSTLAREYAREIQDVGENVLRMIIMYLPILMLKRGF